jgi:predicted DNA-binding protein (MmcQ/YjbR family)
MTPAAFNAFCSTLPGAAHVIQWGDHHVWKVGAKVFAIGGEREDGQARVTFKAGEIAYEVLRDQPGLRPAPYMASRGLKWIQAYGEGPDDEALQDHIARSHALVVEGLSRKARAALGV